MQLEQTKDVYGEEVYNTINFVFGNKDFDTSLNDMCFYGLTKEIIRVLINKSSIEISCDFFIPSTSKKSTFVICHMW